MTESSPSYATTPDSSFEAQYKRVFGAAGCRTQAELAEVLEIRQSSISDAKKRKAIPAEWLMKLFEKKRINPEWIRYGTGAKLLLSTDSSHCLPHVVKVVEVRPPETCSAQDLFTELVRRAMQPLDLEAIQKEVAATWLPVKKTEEKS